MKKRLLLVGGTMGVGKTAVCRRLKEEMPNSVLLDGDWCWDASPFQVTEETRRMVLDNICHLLNNFVRCSAYDTVILCWVMDRQETIDAILERVEAGGHELTCISLTADEASLRSRLEGDVKQGLRGPGAVERSLARLPLYRVLDTVKVDTTGKSVQEVCGAIRRLIST